MQSNQSSRSLQRAERRGRAEEEEKEKGKAISQQREQSADQRHVAVDRREWRGRLHERVCHLHAQWSRSAFDADQQQPRHSVELTRSSTFCFLLDSTRTRTNARAG